MVNSKQRGVTLIGWLFLLTPMAIVFYAGIRIAPIYLNYMRVAKTIDDVSKAEGGDNGANAASIKNAIEKRLDIEGVDFPELKDFIVRREGTVWVIECKYEDVAPMFFNLSLLLTFDKRAELK
jgi:hypothetical protein